LKRILAVFFFEKWRGLKINIKVKKLKGLNENEKWLSLLFEIKNNGR
jgi:hypothetical protein